MVIAIFGESCTGKSTIAECLKGELGARVFSGRDYLRLAKTEQEARAKFKEMLENGEEPAIYVLSEKQDLGLLPKNCLRVLVTADLALIKERFAKRTGGVLPPPVEKMLKSKHGMFNGEPRDLWIISGEGSAETACEKILAMLRE